MIRRYVAETSVGASTKRSYIVKGGARCQDLLYEIELSVLKGKTERQFGNWLERETNLLRAQLRRQRRKAYGVETYGMARKILNIYLHNVYYNRPLCDEYALDAFEGALEVPIDRHVREWLFRIAEETVPQIEINPLIRNVQRIWEIDKKKNRCFQDLAVRAARQLGTTRVHLDAYFYRGNKELWIWEDRLD
jgi:hypothetical protein